MEQTDLLQRLQDLGPEGDGGAEQRQQPEDEQKSRGLNAFDPIVLDDEGGQQLETQGQADVSSANTAFQPHSFSYHCESQ